MKRFFLLSLMCFGCASEPKVVRVYGNHIVEGAYVPPEAYAAYLRGALAEEAGDLKGAVGAYERALDEDDEDPEIWTRAGAVRCKLDPKDTKADDAFAKALKLDRTYAGTFAARATCLTARGKTDEAAAAALEAAKADPTNVDVAALVVRTSKATPGARERAIALTVAAGERAAAWEALVHWGRAHGDAELTARGLEGLARLSPTRSAEIETGALELLGQGFTVYARRVAAAVADVPQDNGGGGPRDATVARLAIDDAILAGDRARIERRAVRGHVALAEVAARAMLLDARETALRVARDEIAADPKNAGAQMVVAAASTTKARELTPATDAVSEACALVFADALAAGTNADSAKTWLARIQRLPSAAHDPVIGPLAVDLAARGVLSADELPIETRIELAARRREAPPAIASLPPGSVDAKHLFLWHALTNPASKESQTLATQLSAAVDRDPLVGFALARVVLSKARDEARWNDIRRAIAAAPAHPLLLAIAVELAKAMGKPDELPPAKARLMAVARTPAERALATE